MGSDDNEKIKYYSVSVSIHAPTWGATFVVITFGCSQVFQSTLPHGERPKISECLYIRLGFNPRSHMGSDLLYLVEKFLKL